MTNEQLAQLYYPSPALREKLRRAGFNAHVRVTKRGQKVAYSLTSLLATPDPDEPNTLPGITEEWEFRKTGKQPMTQNVIDNLWITLYTKASRFLPVQTLQKIRPIP